jgi:thioredoxin 1
MKDHIRIVKLNVDQNPSVPAKYDVNSIPRIILFKNGQEIDKIVGDTPKENIIALLEKHS